jgi:hypothetical protein
LHDFTLTISGRYLVRVDPTQKEDSIRDNLIELDRAKKENLTAYFSNMPHILRIHEKSFSIEGKGDLFTRNFSHFEYIIYLKIK